jgi:hypothetical protein
MAEENTLLNANHIVDVPDEEGKELKLPDNQTSNVIGVIKSRYQSAKDAREVTEKNWLSAYQNYRGVYGKNVKFREHEKSKVFVKITKAKVLAAYGMLVDVVFGTTEFPIGVQETKVPEGLVDKAHLQPSIETSSPIQQEAEPEIGFSNPLDVGYAGDGKILPPGGLQLLDDLGQQTEEYTSENGNVILQPGPAPDPSMPQLNPAKEAARRMQRLIHDQIDESKGDIEIRRAMFEAALLGTGVVKGPYNFNKRINKWSEGEDGKRTYEPLDVRVPRIEFVSCWDLYPDPYATDVDDSDFIIQRRKMTRSELRKLARAPYFRADSIKKCLADGPNYVAEDFEYTIRTDDSSDTGTLYNTRFEVIEYWGVMDAEFLRELGVDVADSVSDLDELQCNIWICGDQVIRAVLNPFLPDRLPYNAFSYEDNPYSFWGVGVAENMEDSQQIMNGHARMAIDNLALSGSVVFDIDETALVPGQSMQIYPGKVFRRQSGAPGQAVYAIKFPNTSQENLMMFDKFRQLADEQTGIPSYSHGQTGVQSMTRTASGMSMLLGAASLNIKTVVKNIDDQLLQPLGEAFFNWNSQFYEGPLGVHGDLEIKAMGTTSLMQKEVRSQRLTMFMQTAANPAIAPYVKMSTLIKEFAHSIDLDPEELLNTPEEAAIAAALAGAMNGQEAGAQAGAAGQAPAGMGGAGGLPEDVTGQPTGTPDGGTIGPRIPQDPSADGFTG